MEKPKYLIEIDEFSEFNNRYSEIITYDWKIFDSPLNSRAYSLGKFSSNKKVMTTESRKNFNYTVNNNDIISYSDVLTLFKRIVDNEWISNTKNISIFMEYLIPFSNNKRIDLLLTFKNTIVLLEFTYYVENEDSNKMDIYHNKLNQVMQYQALLQNIINNKIKTVPYVIIYKPEYNKTEKLEKNIEYNNHTLKTFASLLNKLIVNDTNANEQIKNI